jgi:hypothetical protein
MFVTLHVYIEDDPPPLKWSDLRYVFDIKEDCNGSRLRRVSHGVHRCDTFFGTNWNVEQTKYERGDQPSHA